MPPNLINYHSNDTVDTTNSTTMAEYAGGTLAGESNPRDPLIYILAVISFYVIAIVLLMIKSVHEQGSEGVASSPLQYRSSLVNDASSVEAIIKPPSNQNDIVKADVHRSRHYDSQTSLHVIEAFPYHPKQGRTDV